MAPAPLCPDQDRSDRPTAERLLTGLTEAQRAAVTSESAPLAIIAAAGAGKTRVLTRRIAYRCLTGSAAARHTLALTFTRKAAGELQQRLGALGLREGVAAGTFHSHATAQLQRWWADRRQRPPVLLDRKSRLLMPLVDGRPGLERLALSDVAAVIEWAKARAVAPDGLPAALADAGRIPPGVDPDDLAGLFRRYEHEKTKRGLVDFDDLLGRCADAIAADPEFAAAQRWCWRHIYVDEFQDLNPLQHRLLMAWLGTGRDLCVVGDPNQAIYGWNGADPGLLEDFPRRWSGASILRLDANHRSTIRIVRAAASVLGPEGAHLTGAGREGRVPEVIEFASDQAEARGIAGALVEAHRAGRPWSAMAVLTRTNAQLAGIEEALRLAGVPTWSAASAALLDQPDVRAVLAQLRRVPERPLRVAQADLDERIAELRAGSVGRGSVGTGSGQADAARGLVGLVETTATLLASRPESTIGDWLTWLPAGTRDRSDGRPESDVVTLSSFHRAKGLEWPLVWVAGVEEGLVPMGRKPSDAAEREERRLLYVAMTRAIEELRVSWAATRRFGRATVGRQPSRWLAAVRAECQAQSGSEIPGTAEGTGEPVESGRRRFQRQRISLGRDIGRDLGHGAEFDSVYQSLVQWRLEAARHSGVPPQLLLHDATIEAIAASRPTCLDDLLAIPGLGPLKVGRYGTMILDRLEPYGRTA